MFVDTQTLKNLAGSDRTFKLRKQDGTGTERIDSASTQSEPILMSIKHSVQGNGPAAIDRHLVQFSRTKLNSTTGKPVTSTVNLTLAIPRDSTITVANVEDDLISLLRFICGGSVFDPTADFDGTTFTGLTIGEA
jgi:hypothetical protein